MDNLRRRIQLIKESDIYATGVTYDEIPDVNNKKYVTGVFIPLFRKGLSGLTLRIDQIGNMASGDKKYEIFYGDHSIYVKNAIANSGTSSSFTVNFDYGYNQGSCGISIQCASSTAVYIPFPVINSYYNDYKFIYEEILGIQEMQYMYIPLKSFYVSINDGSIQPCIFYITSGGTSTYVDGNITKRYYFTID